MKKQSLQLLTLVCSGLVASSVSAGVAYPDPPGGWKYIYNGDKDTAGEPGSGFTSLDGTWSHDNGSDEFDGSKIGGTLAADAFGVGNAPGGAMTLTEGGVTFLRMQDPGNPTQYNFPNPSNRKIFFGHDITADGATDTVLDEGIAVTFRARIPTPKKTTGPLDSLYRAGQAAAGVKPYPDTGDGYLVSDGGKGNITIKQAGGGAIAFAFTLADDTFGGNPADPKPNFAGLTMNEFNGNQITGTVDYREGSAFRGVPFDPTEWHEVWIVLRKDPGNVGTHQAFIFVDGSKEPTVLSLTAGDGSDFSGISYIAIGGSRTDENWALDLDFIAFKPGLVFPPGALDKPFVGGFAGTPSGFRLDLADGIAAGSTKVNSASVTVTFDGQTVTAAVSKKDDITTIDYTSPTVLAPNSAHTVKVSFADAGTPPVTQTIERSFTVENYAIIAANTALDETKLERTKRGFRLRPFGTEENNPNTLVWTEDALAGKHGANLADLSAADANGFYTVEGVINFDRTSGHGNFTDANGQPDQPFPGFPGGQTRDGGSGNAIEEILTILEFPKAGLYRMGVNSDDGFRVSTAAPDPRPPAKAQTLGQFDGGRGAADTLFNFAVEAAGIYAFRTIWENGGGDANLEWFMVESDGKKVLINDSATASALKAYQFQVLPVKPGAAKPTVALAREGAQLKITFTGILQSADSVTGPWTDVANAASPFTASPSVAQRFYRTKQ